jgi:hypothetical protein
MFSGDGDPYNKLIRLKEVDGKKYGRIMALPQMFNFYMKLQSKTSILFQDVMCHFLANVIGTWDLEKTVFSLFGIQQNPRSISSKGLDLRPWR